MIFFFFNNTAPPEFSTLSLHDPLPISQRHLARRPGRPARRDALRRDEARRAGLHARHAARPQARRREGRRDQRDRKSTRLNSSHANISYAVFCLKKKIISIIPSSTLST